MGRLSISDTVEVDSNLIHFDKKCIPTDEYVVLEMMRKDNIKTTSGIILPDTAYANERLGFYKVIEVGKTAFEEYGLKSGDYVVGDRLASTMQSYPITLMKYYNIIAKTNETNTTFSPLKNMVFVRDERNDVTQMGSLYVKNYKKRMNIGEIVAMNISDDITVPYKKGDMVLISKGGDSFQVGTEHVFIYKHDMICAKVCEDE